MNHAAEVEVSVAEVCEVRGAALEGPELLAIVASGSEVLPKCPKGTVFDADNVFITANGKVVIHTIPSMKADNMFTPPEWTRGEDDPNAAAVYCMGAVLRSVGAEVAADVDLFSLVNIMTVGQVGTRPTSHRMGQMARNQLQGRNAQATLIALYEEVMGDEESNRMAVDDMDIEDLDELDDDFDMGHVEPRKTTKQAVEYISDSDDGSKETRGASLSTSSGTSTQKETSPFEDEIIEEEIIERKVPSPIPPPRSPRSFEVIGSPGAQSAKFNETFIEEQSIDISFDRSHDSREESFGSKTEEKPTEATVIVNSSKRPIENPFNENNNELEGTLSGRDPFEQSVSNRSTSPPAKKSPPSELSQFVVDTPPSPARHRFSSSEDEIVEAHIDDDDIFTSSRGRDYFNDIRREVEPVPVFKQTAVPTIVKHAALVEQMSSASEMSHTTQASSAKRGSSFAETSELERLKAETEEIREEAGRLSRRHSREAEKILEAERLETSILSSSEDEEDGGNRSHVEAAVVIAEPPPRVKSAQKVVESESDEDAASEMSIEEAFNEARRNSQAPAAAAPQTIVSPIGDSPKVERLERHNSLVPARISRRTSTRNSRGKRKTRAVPEFYETGRHPSIRLKAPSSRKKKVTLMRVEQSEVWVELLNGQRVEVACRTDVTARDVFSLVVQHMNINEHIFFGLSVMRDGEHFFLDDHQRLEKYAPPGWKSGSRAAQRHQYVLFLRFRFYPQILEFIKTPVTLHELYLQVRRDVIDERIQPKRDAAFELAAVALQAEFGNRPPPAVVDYFDNEHYLAKRFCTNDDPRRLKVVLADLHSHYTNTPMTEAEHKFIQICQRHGDFGGHLHRVFRSKPTGSVGAAPFDPDTGAALWISIMPRGISVYEEEGGVRQKLSEHLWPDTQTLQFDKKKCVIIAVRDGHQTETIFYTDHHSKSSYFVKFSASQHRFMMKMRAWKTTLRHENTIQAMPDVAVEGTPAPAPVRVVSPTPLEEAGSMFEKMPPKSEKRPSVAPPQLPQYDSPPRYTPEPAPRILDVSVASTNTSERVDANETVSNSFLERFEAATETPNGRNDDGAPMQFRVTLVKDPKSGLGLTLVDGNLNGIKGVYVKSVAENGAGMREGLRVGDRLLSVGGQSLEGGDRHMAVELVKGCGNQVTMEIGRMDGVVRHEKSVSRDGDVLSKQLNGSAIVNGTPKGVSRTPPAPRRAGNRRVRAVSDFGAIGDQLPALDNENVINIKAISGLHLDESDEERGEYRLPTASMYAFDRYDDDEPPTPKEKKPTVASSSPLVSRQGAEAKKKHRYARKSSNPEWAEELENVDEDDSVIYVTLERNSQRSLGVQIATVNGKATIKQLTAPPALGHPNLRVGMILVSVHGEETEGKSHNEVVELLRQGDRVVLGLKAEDGQKDDGDTFTVTLRMKEHGSLGLSLSRRTGSEGNFIRKIEDGSAAADEGSLKVGDRVVSVDGVQMEGMSLPSVLDRLRSIPAGSVRITVSRPTA